MYSVTGDTTSLVPGFPIRTSSDPRSVDSSPRHNAASHVLHRLPVPRHPPCALKHLQHKHNKNSRKNQKLHISTHHHTIPPPTEETASSCVRCSQPLSTNQTPHPTTKAGQQQPPPTLIGGPPPTGRQPISGFPHSGRRDSGLVVSKPNSVSGGFVRPVFPHRSAVCCAPEPHPLQMRPIVTIRPAHRTPTQCGRVWVSWCSLERR